MRIVYFGLPLAAWLLHEDGHDIALAVLSRSACPGERRLAAHLGRERVLVRSKLTQNDLSGRVGQAGADLLVSWFWTSKLPPSLVECQHLGGIGVHPSLLPRHRGPDPYFAAIDQGDALTGVTVHRIADEYDTGPILASEPLTIDPEWNAWQLARRLDRPSLALLRKTVAALARGENPVESVQDEARATWAPTPTLDDCALRWSWPTDKVLRRIRALAPAPGAFTELRERALTITSARQIRDFPRALSPGEATVTTDGAVVRTGDGAVLLLQGEIDDQPVGREELASLFAQERELVLG